MRKYIQQSTVVISSAIFLTFLAGCTSSQMRNRNLKRVSKDWCMTIRASQVIPVYPLSEDIQPGDVLLVTIPIEEQAKVYEKKGFLPLDQHLVRISVTNEYADFYDNRYAVTSNAPPLNWQVQDGSTNHNWKSAPASAFPSYTFDVESGAKGGLALPIEGVPFAMSFMNSSKATGSITISDSHTYGLDIETLYKKVKHWGNDNRTLLFAYRPQSISFNIFRWSTWSSPDKWLGEHQYRRSYLRVVSRVHVTSRLNVSLDSTRTFGTRGAAGVAASNETSTATALLSGTNSTRVAAENNITNLATLTSTINDMMPSANFSINTFSSSSVNMDQTFKRPLVIGYIGFDIPILEGGRLGSPISTLSQLGAEKSFQLEIAETLSVERLRALVDLYEKLDNDAKKDNKAAEIKLRLDRMSREVSPIKYPVNTYTYENKNQNVKIDQRKGTALPGSTFEEFALFIGKVSSSITDLERVISTPTATDQNNADYKELLLLRKQLQQEFDKTDNSAIYEMIDYVLY